MIKIEIIVDTDTVYTFTEDSGLIEGVSLYKCLDDTLEGVSGDVECGELNLQLSNLYNEFSPFDSESPYGLITNGQNINVYSVDEEDTDTVIFTGVIVDYTAPTDTNTQYITLRAVDALYSVLNSEITGLDLQIDSDILLTTYLTSLLHSCGIATDKISIDTTLSTVSFPFSILDGTNIADQLNNICTAADCYIYVDCGGIITVIPRNIEGEEIATFTRSSKTHYLTSSTFGKSYTSSYKTLRVSYTGTSLSDVQEVLSVSSLTVPIGTNTFDTYTLDTTNLYELDSILIKSDAVTLTSVSVTASSIVFTLYNSSEDDEIISLVVYGKTVETSEAYTETELTTEEIDQNLTISSTLIQTKTQATSISSSLYARLTPSIPYIEIEAEVNNLGLKLGDIVKVEDSDADIEYLGYIHTLDLEYDGQGYGIYTLGVKYVEEEEEDIDEL